MRRQARLECGGGARVAVRRKLRARLAPALATLAFGSLLVADLRAQVLQPKPTPTLTPTVTTARPTVQPNLTTPCVVRSTTPAAGPPGIDLTVTGSAMDGCRVDFTCGNTTVMLGPVSTLPFHVPNFPAQACRVSASTIGADPRPATGAAFTVTAPAPGDCTATSLSTAHGLPATTIHVLGTRLDQGCAANFGSPALGNNPWLALRIDATHLQVVVGQTPAGAGALRIVPLAKLQQLTASTPGLPFRVWAPNTPTPVWSQSVAQSSSMDVTGIATDAAGNAIVVGSTFGSLTVTGKPSLYADLDVLLMKVARDGSVTWAKVFNSKSAGSSSWTRDAGTSVALDPSGNILLIGTHEGSIDFGNGPLAPGAPRSIDSRRGFLAKLDPNGVGLWSKELGDTYLNAIASDASGNVVVTGETYSQHVFVQKWSPAGALLWSKEAGGSYSVTSNYAPMHTNQGRAVACDAAGNVFVAGSFAGSMDLGAGAVTAVKGLDGFVAKLTPSGTPVWVKGFDGGADFDSVNVVEPVPNGDVVISGVFRGQLVLGASPMTDYNGDGTPFAARYTAAGAHVWSRVLPTRPQGSRANVSSVHVGDGNWLWIAGTVSGTVDLGLGNVTTSPGGSSSEPFKLEPFFVGLDATTGLTRRATLLTGGKTIVLTGRGTSFFFSGTYGASIDAGGGALPAPPAYLNGLYVAAWGTAPPPPPPTPPTSLTATP